MAELFSGLNVPGWFTSDNGLLLPSSVDDLHVAPGSARSAHEGFLVAERHRPLGNAFVYATPAAMNVAPVPLDEFVTILSSIRLGMILPVVCELQALLHGNEMNRDLQLGLATGLFGGTAALPPLVRFMRTHPGEPVAFCEQGLTLLQQLAIRHCEDEPTGLTEAEYVARIRWAIFFVTDYLSPHSGTPAADRSSWLGLLTRLFDYNGHEIFANAMARAWVIFGRLQRESSDIKPAIPLDEWFKEDYGLTLEQQITLGFALFSLLGMKGEGDGEFKHQVTAQDLGWIFGHMGLSEVERIAAEGLVAAPQSWFRDQTETQSVDQLSWNQVPFMQRPLIRLRSGNYASQSPRAITTWVAEGVYYRGLDSARRRGAVDRYTARVGKLTERYVLRLVESAHGGPRLPAAGKVHGDKKFGKGLDSSDITVTYPHEVVMIEVASHRLTVRSKRDGDGRALRHDLTEMVGRRPRQLLRSIDAMKPRLKGISPTLSFDRLKPAHVARFWPVIVTVTPIHRSPLLDEFLEDGSADLAAREDVEALEMFPVEDMEALVAITEQTGHRLADLLAAKQGAVGPHTDVRTWLSRDRRFPRIARPTYLEQALDETMDIAQGLLGLDSTDHADAA